MRARESNGSGVAGGNNSVRAAIACQGGRCRPRRRPRRRLRAPGRARTHRQFVPALIQKVRRLNAWEIVRIRSLDDAPTILDPMARRGPCDYSNRSAARLLRLSGGGTRLVPAVRNRLPERVVIDAADHINSFSDLEMKSK
jgi:hypothetical protein